MFLVSNPIPIKEAVTKMTPLMPVRTACPCAR